MSRGRWSAGSLVASLLAALGGCAEVEGDLVDEEPQALAETVEIAGSQAALVASGTHVLDADHSVHGDIGSAAGRVCFLTGVKGSLTPSTTPSAGRAVGVRVKGDRYEMFVDVDVANGKKLGLETRCVTGASRRTEERQWNAGEPPKVLADVTFGRKCFLTGVRSRTVPGFGAGFKQSADKVQVYNDGKSWYLTGSQSGFASATAQCVDTGLSAGFWVWQAGDPGARKDFLTTIPGDVDCFLTAVGGRFDGGDLSDGVHIGYETDTKNFFLHTKNGKSGYVLCTK